MKIVILISLVLLSGCGMPMKERIEIIKKTADDICQEDTALITLRTDGVVEFTWKPKASKPL